MVVSTKINATKFMKRISDLNDLKLYRFIKVLFLFLVFLVFSFFILSSSDDFKPSEKFSDYNDIYKITCLSQYGFNKTFEISKKSDEMSYGENIKDYLERTQPSRDNLISQIKAKCNITKLEFELREGLRDKFEKETCLTKHFSPKEVLKCKLSLRNLEGYPQELYDQKIGPKEVSNTYFLRLVTIFFKYTISLLFILEVSRRIAYYVFLGKINPEK